MTAAGSSNNNKATDTHTHTRNAIIKIHLINKPSNEDK